MGCLMRLKTEGYRIELLVGCRLIPNNINDPIFTIFIICATILSAVEGLNGFKKLNIKDIGFIVSVFPRC